MVSNGLIISHQAVWSLSSLSYSATLAIVKYNTLSSIKCVKLLCADWWAAGVNVTISMQTMLLSWFAKYFLMMTCLPGDHKQLHLCLPAAWSSLQMILPCMSSDCWHEASCPRQDLNWSRSNKSCWIAVMKSIFWVKASLWSEWWWQSSENGGVGTGHSANISSDWWPNFCPR